MANCPMSNIVLNCGIISPGFVKKGKILCYTSSGDSFYSYNPSRNDRKLWTTWLLLLDWSKPLEYRIRMAFYMILYRTMAGYNSYCLLYIQSIKGDLLAWWRGICNVKNYDCKNINSLSVYIISQLFLSHNCWGLVFIISTYTKFWAGLFCWIFKSDKWIS